jgi:DNA-nicking Smr family endonuclease
MFVGKKKERRRKVNKYADEGAPEAELDFHGKGVLYPEDIERICSEFLDKCIKKKMKRVLVITGKGLHSSEGGPVVKPVIVKFLNRDGRVFRFTEARRDRGGSGAFEVELNS